MNQATKSLVAFGTSWADGKALLVASHQRRYLMSMESLFFLSSFDRPKMERHFAFSISAGFRIVMDRSPIAIEWVGVDRSKLSWKREGGERISTFTGGEVL